MAAAIADGDGRILVTRRPDHVHQGGLWEFPGGKLEHGEGPEEGLARELNEELGIQVRSSRPLIRIPHDYGDRHILLDVRRVTAYEGIPRGLEGQPLAWLLPEDMDPSSFPAADRPIITALRLPQLLLITGPDPRYPTKFLLRLEAALARGVRLVQLRAHELAPANYRRLAEQAFRLCETAGGRLLLNRDPQEVKLLPRHGLHLRARTLASLRIRPGLPDDVVGASCHDAEELAKASALGLDYALLSPVKPTRSHPGVLPLGWSRFGELVDPLPMPIYALGGLHPRDLGEAIHSGAQGIAAIGGLWPE
jgi:8-oxo-dGTP diphosphatase